MAKVGAILLRYGGRLHVAFARIEEETTVVAAFVSEGEWTQEAFTLFARDLTSGLDANDQAGIADRLQEGGFKEVKPMSKLYQQIVGSAIGDGR
jgi:hypothetical protein